MTAADNTGEDKKKHVEGEQGRATFKPGSTTGAGSDFGQGTTSLGPESYQQGQVENDGSNYDNEDTDIPGNNNKQEIEGAGNIPHE